MPDIIEISRGLGIFNDVETRFQVHYAYGSGGWWVCQGDGRDAQYLWPDGTWHRTCGDEGIHKSRDEAMRVLELAVIRKINSFFNEMDALKGLTGRMA